MARPTTVDHNTEYLDPISNNYLCVQIEVFNGVQRKRKKFERGGERDVFCYCIRVHVENYEQSQLWEKRGYVGGGNMVDEGHG